jgi:hypothetical protein
MNEAFERKIIEKNLFSTDLIAEKKTFTCNLSSSEEQKQSLS